MPLSFLARTASAPLLFWLQEPTPFDAAQYGGSGGASFFLMLVETILALGLVCGLAYAIFRWVLPRLQATHSANSMVRVVDRAGLDARKNLYVIEVAGRWLLVASSEAGVQLISELDAGAAEEAAAALERMRPGFRATTDSAREAFADRFARMINKRK